MAEAAGAAGPAHRPQTALHGPAGGRGSWGQRGTHRTGNKHRQRRRSLGPRGGPAQLLPSPGDQRETLQEPLLDTTEYGVGEPHRTRPVRSRTLGHSQRGRLAPLWSPLQDLQEAAGQTLLAQASQAWGAESVSTRAFRARGAWHAIQPREQTGQNL